MSSDPIAVEDYAIWYEKKHGKKLHDSPFIIFKKEDLAEEQLSKYIEGFLKQAKIPEELVDTSRRFKLFVQPSLEERVTDLEKRSNSLEARIEQIEHNDKRAYLEENWFEIVGTIMKLFSSIESLVQVYCKKKQFGLDILFIHESDRRVEKQEEILAKTLDLEEKYPKLAFDYLILRTDEVSQADLASGILVFDNTKPA